MRRIEIKLGQHPISKTPFSFDSCKKVSLHLDPQNLVNETQCPLLLHAVLVKQTVKSVTATATRGGYTACGLASQAEQASRMKGA